MFTHMLWRTRPSRNKYGVGFLSICSLFLTPYFLSIILLLLWPGICSAGTDQSSEEIFQARPAKIKTELIGFTRARQVMDLVSKEAGFCRTIAGDIGDVIGDQGIFAQLETIYIDLQIQENKLRQKQLQSKVSFLGKEVKRYRNLFKTQNVDESTLDRFENELEQARQGLKLEQTREKQLQEQRADHIIRAHPGWKIIARNVEPGEWVRSGQVVGRAGDYQTMLIPFALSPEELMALRANPNSIFLDFPNQKTRVKARIERISPDFDPETRKTRLDLEVSGKKLEARGGQRAVLELQILDPSGAVWVPKSALLTSYGEHLLVRETGQRVPVVLLDQGPQDTFRVKSSHVEAGDNFKINPDISP